MRPTGFYKSVACKGKSYVTHVNVYKWCLSVFEQQGSAEYVLFPQHEMTDVTMMGSVS